MSDTKLNDPLIMHRAVRGYDPQECFDLLTDLMCYYKGKAFSKALRDNLFISEDYYQKLIKAGRA